MTTKKFLGEVHEKTKKNEQKNRQKNMRSSNHFTPIDIYLTH